MLKILIFMYVVNRKENKISGKCDLILKLPTQIYRIYFEVFLA